MNATPSSWLPSARISLLALTLTACGIETKPIANPSMGGAGEDGGAGTDSAKSGSGGRSGAGAGASGKAGSSGSAAGGSAGTAAEAGSGGAAGEAGGGGEAGSAGGEPECDESKSPKDEPCLVADEYAVFVKSGGVLGAAGTMDAPLPTVSAGIAAAVANDIGRVIVCGGDYAEVVEITAGVSVYGGFDCSDEPWAHTGSAATRVLPSAKGEALRIVDVEDAVLVEDLEFTAKDADVAGESSVAALVKGSAAVTLRGVTITAGDGKDGADGDTAALDFENFPKVGAPTETCANIDSLCLAGYPATGGKGGGARPYTCPAGDTTRGGTGGDYDDDVDPAVATAGSDGRPDELGGIGGPASGGTGCTNGGVGTGGTNGDVHPGAQTHGLLIQGAWTPTEGSNGGHGKVGGGGGGGGAQKPNNPDPARGGGGGGGGGCGGAGGAGGAGGGGSIALIAIDSGVTFLLSTLVTGTAGDGGSGDEGQNGTAGGAPGVGRINNVGCDGGRGGAGGKGGAGGGGAGGISVGVVWKGTEPVIDQDTNIERGTAGNAGTGGDNNDGVAGIADVTYEIEP